MKEQVLESLAPYGQRHLLAYWDELDQQQRDSLATEIRGIDFEMLDRLRRRTDDEDELTGLADRATSPPAFRLETSQNRFTPQQARCRATEALGAAEVGVVLVAGGQGTRLGFAHPKGMFQIGPVSGNTLFQIHIEKIRAVARRYGVRVPLYLMTSRATHDETVEFLARGDRFGLPQEDLQVFCQGTMPAIDEQTGKVLLAERHHVFLSPDGHGGMLCALAASGALDDIGRRGIKQLFYLQVDNPLVETCSPEFLGYHLLSDSELSTQVIAKRDPLEKVGNVVKVDGKLRIIEYSDLPEEVARRRASDGALAIWAGSIAVHAMDVAFLERMAGTTDALPFHVARKKVPCIDSTGRRVEPSEPNAIKFERFIFDLMPSAANAIVVEVDRARDFAPLKNASGQKHDTPETVKAQMVALHTQWLRQAGVEIADGVDVEISPLFASDAEELAGKLEPGTRVSKPTYYG